MKYRIGDKVCNPGIESIVKRNQLSFVADTLRNYSVVHEIK